MSRITGTIANKNIFKFHETDYFDIEPIEKIIEGNLSGYIFRNAIDPRICQKIIKNYSDNIHVKERDDGVPGTFLGTYLYRKNLLEYLEQAQRYNKILPEIFSGTVNIFDRYINLIKSELRTKKTIRPAKYYDQEACHFFARSWYGPSIKKYALEPHEDGVRCIDKDKLGFEIQSTINSPIIAINFCLENDETGNLHFWNIQPDQNTKKNLGLEITGYPYSIEMMYEFDMIDLRINPGDIYFFNGKNIHAVGAPKYKDQYRTTIACLMGTNSNNELIYWT